MNKQLTNSRKRQVDYGLLSFYLIGVFVVLVVALHVRVTRQTVTTYRIENVTGCNPPGLGFQTESCDQYLYYPDHQEDQHVTHEQMVVTANTTQNIVWWKP
jgi:hypothetical protein